VLGATIRPTSKLEIQTWNYTADRLFNVAFQKAEWKKRFEKQTIMAGVQYAWQKSLYNDSLAIEKQYITRNEQSHTFSGRISLSNQTHQQEWSLNYTRITKHGRFLFPREWGIEPFYTFMQRERNEGAGDVHAIMLQHARALDKHSNLT
jgi:hypothetical protein